MNGKELFDQFNRFFLDTQLNTIDVVKKDGKIISTINWKIGNMGTEVSSPKESDIVPWINRNKHLMQFS